MQRLVLPLLALACGSDTLEGSDTAGTGATAPTVACDYPSGVVEPMALDGVIPPFSWPKAKSLLDGTTTALDLTGAFCDSAEDIDWSPFDVLLFVSVPAW